jgi:hypothetical protein
MGVRLQELENSRALFQLIAELDTDLEGDFYCDVLPKLRDAHRKCQISPVFQQLLLEDFDNVKMGNVDLAAVAGNYTLLEHCMHPLELMQHLDRVAWRLVCAFPDKKHLTADDLGKDEVFPQEEPITVCTPGTVMGILQNPEYDQFSDPWPKESPDFSKRYYLIATEEPRVKSKFLSRFTLVPATDGLDTVFNEWIRSGAPIRQRGEASRDAVYANFRIALRTGLPIYKCRSVQFEEPLNIVGYVDLRNIDPAFRLHSPLPSPAETKGDEDEGTEGVSPEPEPSTPVKHHMWIKCTPPPKPKPKPARALWREPTVELKESQLAALFAKLKAEHAAAKTVPEKAEVIKKAITLRWPSPPPGFILDFSAVRANVTYVTPFWRSTMTDLETGQPAKNEDLSYNIDVQSGEAKRKRHPGAKSAGNIFVLNNGLPMPDEAEEGDEPKASASTKRHAETIQDKEGEEEEEEETAHKPKKPKSSEEPAKVSTIIRISEKQTFKRVAVCKGDTLNTAQTPLRNGPCDPFLLNGVWPIEPNPNPKDFVINNVAPRAAEPHVFILGKDAWKVVLLDDGMNKLLDSFVDIRSLPDADRLKADEQTLAKSRLLQKIMLNAKPIFEAAEFVPPVLVTRVFSFHFTPAVSQ